MCRFQLRVKACFPTSDVYCYSIVLCGFMNRKLSKSIFWESREWMGVYLRCFLLCRCFHPNHLILGVSLASTNGFICHPFVKKCGTWEGYSFQWKRASRHKAFPYMVSSTCERTWKDVFYLIFISLLVLKWLPFIKQSWSFQLLAWT